MVEDRICGIYCIENIINHKRYIGQSVDIYKRWHTHRYLLNENKHDNDYLQKAWNKYGENNFVFSILERCDKGQLSKMETHYIDVYQTLNEDYGYNLQSGGVSDYYLSDITKQKISEALIGKMAGENNPRYGKSVSDNTKEKIRKANTNPSEETRQKMREARLGTKASDETKRKLSEAHKNRPRAPHSEETKKKLSIIAKERFKDPKNNPMYGKKHSDESKKKIGDGHRNPSEETREKMRKSAKDRCTEDWRRAMSEKSKKQCSGKNNPNAKHVYQYSTEWKLVKIWDMSKDIAEEFHVSRSTISGTWLKHPSKIYKGFHWSLFPITLQNDCEVK